MKFLFIRFFFFMFKLVYCQYQLFWKFIVNRNEKSAEQTMCTAVHWLVASWDDHSRKTINKVEEPLQTRLLFFYFLGSTLGWAQWNLSYLEFKFDDTRLFQKLFWPFTVWINSSCNLETFENSRPSTSNFKTFSRSLEQFFLTVLGQNNFGNKLPIHTIQISSCFFYQIEWLVS